MQTVADAGGWSHSSGPCDKNAKGRTRAVLEFAASTDDFRGILLAHEVGHYLTLRHANTITNLMGVDSDNDGIGELAARAARSPAGEQPLLLSGSALVQ